MAAEINQQITKITEVYATFCPTDFLGSRPSVVSPSRVATTVLVLRAGSLNSLARDPTVQLYTHAANTSPKKNHARVLCFPVSIHARSGGPSIYPPHSA